LGSKWYELQPLGTEGQGIVAGKKTYSRTQLSIPAGISIIYKSNSRVRIGFEIGYRKTFTDYLDDVSTIYFDENILVEQKGTVAGAVSNRTREITTDPDQLVYFQAGSQRGDPTDKDSYIFSVFSINYLLNYETCPTFNSKSLFRKYRGFKIGY
ncbi:MAG: hypothetical protein IIA45_14425, partial [Bacteroidetes bacterium]|nr:hypothetical protein [Bacteroidota bacterium]